MLENFADIDGIGLILHARPIVELTVLGADKLPMLGETDACDRARRCTIPTLPGWFVITITFSGVLIEEDGDSMLLSAMPADSFTPFSDEAFRHQIVVQAASAEKALRCRDVKSFILDFVDAIRRRNYQGAVDVTDEYGTPIVELTFEAGNDAGVTTARRTR